MNKSKLAGTGMHWNLMHNPLMRLRLRSKENLRRTELVAIFCAEPVICAKGGRAIFQQVRMRRCKVDLYHSQKRPPNLMLDAFQGRRVYGKRRMGSRKGSACRSKLNSSRRNGGQRKYNGRSVRISTKTLTNS